MTIGQNYTHRSYSHFFTGKHEYMYLTVLHESIPNTIHLAKNFIPSCLEPGENLSKFGSYLAKTIKSNPHERFKRRINENFWSFHPNLHYFIGVIKCEVTMKTTQIKSVKIQQ
ncbi:hypothetical protein RF11_03240 [Thelohanellus kitauei]|uniref:Uncharacterized protein n=1 Tax=Thelohanellus kitauei TaxID=669202 RepID=A0A0C2IFV6_THEKT|nr:hypothetical protein RF11_03240 [Thelohanellus kitauei]